MLNWIIRGTDAHPKNFSMLIGPQGRGRLAPLYDVASMLPYDVEPTRLKMATKIGGKYLLDEVHSRHWVKFATEVRLPPAEVIDMGNAIAEILPVVLAEIVDDARANGLDHLILQRMIGVLNARLNHCARVLEAATA